MTNLNYNTENLKGKHLSYEQRILLEDDLKSENFSLRKSAKHLGCSPSTIANELKRGQEPYHIHKQIKSRPYKAKYAQERYEQNRKASHRLEFFEEFPNIKEKLLELLRPKKGRKRISVEVALYLLSKDFINLPTARTVYHNIQQGKLGREVQSWVGTYRKKKNKFEKHDYKRVLGTSIEQRPEIINQRLEFGHWEIDLVLGKRQKGEVLLTLLERVSSFYLVVRCPDKRAETINQKIKETFATYGKKNFKSLTTDNGSEFSKLTELKNIPTYFCHPFSSWEKGANERHNRMLREFIPKGTPIEDYSYFELLSAQKQINQYPRKSKNFFSPEEIFLQNIA